MTRVHHRHVEDRGSVLTMMLAIVVGVSLVTIVLAEFVNGGLRQSVFTTSDTQLAADVETAANWYITELAHKSDDRCLYSVTAPGQTHFVTVPVRLLRTQDTSALMTCRFFASQAGHPVVKIRATVSAGTDNRTVETTVHISLIDELASVLTWEAS